MANNECLSTLKKGVESWNKWRDENPYTLPDLSGADLRAEDFSKGNFSGANLERALLGSANFRDADLRNTNLSEADLGGAYLRKADLGSANLAKANLSLANLADASLNKANLNLAKLWGVQTLGWSIKRVICEWTYWDREARKPTRYEPGEFERLYSGKPIIAMNYEGGITPIEIITLPDMMAKLALQYPGCALRIESIIHELDDASVEIAVDESGGVDLERLERDWKKMQVSQRKVLGI